VTLSSHQTLRASRRTPLETGQAAFPYIRLFGGSFSRPPLYDTGSGLCESWV
jgi:hypothetical protein